MFEKSFVMRISEDAYPYERDDNCLFPEYFCLWPCVPLRLYYFIDLIIMFSKVCELMSNFFYYDNVVDYYHKIKRLLRYYKVRVQQRAFKNLHWY